MRATSLEDGSPLKLWTAKQALLLQGWLGEHGHRVKVRYAMRYGSPSIASELDALKAEASVYAIGIGDRSFGGVNAGVLNKLCEATGGRAYFPKDPSDLDRAFAQLEQDLRQQYLLAYEPENGATDGAFRKIEVRVNNRGDSKEMRIRHRRGYYAPKS